MSRYRELADTADAAAEAIEQAPGIVELLTAFHAVRPLVPEMAAALREADARIEELEAGLRAIVGVTADANEQWSSETAIYQAIATERKDLAASLLATSGPEPSRVAVQETEEP